MVPDDSARFELRRSRRPWGPASLLFVLALVVLFQGDPQALMVEDWPRVIMIVLLAVTVPALVLRFGQQRAPEVIEVLPGAVRLPFGASSVEIPIDEVDGVALEEGDRPGLFVSTSRFVVFFPQNRFLTPEAARSARDVIKERIKKLPDGQRRIAAMDERDYVVPGPARRPWATEGILLVFVVVYLAALFLGDLDDHRPLDPIRLGANARVLVQAGEWWRLPASVLAHSSIAHLALIVMSLFGLGVATERLLGPVGFLVVFLGSALAGALASAAFPDGVAFTMGASGGVFGLLGALLYIYWRFRGKITLRLQIPERTWFWMLAVNFLLPILVPTVDGAMHLGGLTAGVLLAMLVAGDATAVPVAKVTKSSAAVATFLAGLYVASAGAMASAHGRDQRHKELMVMRTLTGFEHPNPDLFNVVAWSKAIDPEATADELVVAEKLAQRAVESFDVWVYRDTWATAMFRRGDTQRAVELELEAMIDEAAKRKTESKPGRLAEGVKSADTVLATQLARFLDVHVARHGIMIAPKASAPLLRVFERDQRVVLAVDSAVVERSTQVWVLAKENGALVGLGRFPIPAIGAYPAEITTRETIAWSKTATLTVAMYSPGEGEAKAWPLEPLVLAYPGPLEAR